MDAFGLIIAVLGGVFCIFCSYKDYDWFFNNHKARGVVSMFGREGARKFYYILGAVLIIVGLAVGTHML